MIALEIVRVFQQILLYLLVIAGQSSGEFSQLRGEIFEIDGGDVVLQVLGVLIELEIAQSTLSQIGESRPGRFTNDLVLLVIRQTDFFFEFQDRLVNIVIIDVASQNVDVDDVIQL